MALLMIAAKEGDKPMVELLLSSGADVAGLQGCLSR